MKSVTIFKGACLTLFGLMLPLSQAIKAEEMEASMNISGWINEGVLFYDDGQGSDVVQLSDNGTTLGNRITFSGMATLPKMSGLKAGFEVILEPLSNSTPLIFSNQDTVGDTTGGDIGVLGHSAWVSGPFGKVTLGLQSMPTDNIAVLADPSLTLWSSISPVFRGNGFFIRGLDGFQDGDGNTVRPVWGHFLNCMTASGLRQAGGIGIDCNGIYRNGIRYDLPALGPVNVAIGYANDDVYDIAAKYNAQLNDRIKAVVHLGYSVNKAGYSGNENGITVAWEEASNFQAQLGLMDSETGIFGTFAFQMEDADDISVSAGSIADDTTAWWFKGGIKRAFSSIGDTAITFQYGQYKDQHASFSFTDSDGNMASLEGSRVDRIGFSVDQYFGSKFLVYAAYENLDLDVDGIAVVEEQFENADSLDIFSLGFTYFF